MLEWKLEDVGLRGVGGQPATLENESEACWKLLFHKEKGGGRRSWAEEKMEKIE